MFVPHFAGFFIYAGTINRSLQLLTVFQNVANGLLFCGCLCICGRDKSALQLLTVCQNVANGLEFCGCLCICGHDKSAPTAADRLPFCGCLRICKHHKNVRQRTLATCYNTTTYTECLLLHCKNHTFAM